APLAMGSVVATVGQAGGVNQSSSTAGSENVREYMEALRDPSAEVVVVSGPAGTGKTMLACEAAARALDRGEVRQIGSVSEKMSLWVKPLLTYLSRFLSEDKLRELQADGAFQ
ncbi:DNA-(apurinic or apyrimidinic site) lyase, partial [Perkinsus olseni]